MAIYNVSNNAQLQTALGKAVGGDRIILADGNYGAVSIYSRNYASNVTIEAATPNHGAHLDGLFLSKSKNITFAGLDIGRSLKSGENTDWTQLSWMRDASNITLKNIEFHGSEDNNPKNDGVGMVASRINGLRVEGSDFSELFRGLSVQQSTNVNITGNEFKTLRSDGITMAASVNVTIDGNSFSDFRPKVGDHADGIQFWNTGQKSGSANVTIKNNLMWFPEVNATPELGMQGIFISDPLSYGYKNVTIDNNLIYTNDAWNGIMVRGATGVKVTNNSVLSASDDAKMAWIRVENSNTVSLQNNVTDNIKLTAVGGLSQINNLNLNAVPSLRSLFKDLDNPLDLHDLVIANAGFHPIGQAIAPPPPAPPPPVADKSPAPVPTSLDAATDDGASKVSTLNTAQPVIIQPSIYEAGFDLVAVDTWASVSPMVEHWTALP